MFITSDYAAASKRQSFVYTLQFTSQPHYDLMLTLHVLYNTINKTHLTAQGNHIVEGEVLTISER